MPVSESTSVAQKATLSADQSKAAAALLRANTSPTVAELGELFTGAGHELALVGGPVRDVFLGGRPKDLDLTTDAVPERVLEITRAWADKTWTVGIEFGTVGLRKGDEIFEITTYRSEAYDRASRKPEVKYGTSLVADLERRDFTINAMAARLPSFELVDPFGGLAGAAGKGNKDAGAAGGLLLRRPAAHPAGGAVRRPARFHGGRRGAGGDARHGTAAVDRLGGADHRRAHQADADRRRPRPGSTCWCAPAWPRSSCPSCPRCGWKSTSTTGTRTSTRTR